MYVYLFFIEISLNFAIQRRYGLHSASRTSLCSRPEWVPETSQGRQRDISRWVQHMLQGPHRGTDNNVHVPRHERDTATRQPTNPQHSRQHHMFGHGISTSECEFSAECDSQYAATEP